MKRYNFSAKYECDGEHKLARFLVLSGYISLVIAPLDQTNRKAASRRPFQSVCCFVCSGNRLRLLPAPQWAEARALAAWAWVAMFELGGYC